MITYPVDYNPVKEYYQWILKHPNSVGMKIKRQLKKLVDDIERKDSDVYFDPVKSNHALGFIENYCRNIKGKAAGQLVVLDLWEKAFVASIFGIVYKNSGLRRTRRAILIIGKKNGKSLLAACIALYMLTVDGEGGPECYAVATKKDQAKIIWGVAKRMIPKDKHLKKILKALVGEIECLINDGTFKALASDSDTLDGLDVHFCSFDEIHQWKNGMELYDIMYRGMGNREQPLALIMSTAGTIREDIYDILYEEASSIIRDFDKEDGFKDDESVFFIYELDNRNEWRQWDRLIKANPGLGTIRNEDALFKEWEKTKNNPDLNLKMFLTKNCNIPETATTAYLSSTDIENPAKFDIAKLKPDYVLGGVDMSSTTDLTCVTFLFMMPDDPTMYVDQMYFLPEDNIEDKAVIDKVPYLKWAERGLLQLVPGNKVSQEYVWEWVRAYVEKNDIIMSWSGFDTWGAEYLMKQWKGHFGEKSVEEVIQGYKTRSNPLKSLKADLRKNLINFNDNPILRWCLANVNVKVDNNANVDPVKGRSKLLRIDGAISLLNAYITLQRHEEDYKNLI